VANKRIGFRPHDQFLSVTLALVSSGGHLHEGPVFGADVHSLLYNLRMSNNPRVKISRSKRYVIEPPVKVDVNKKVIPPGSKTEVKYWQLTISAKGTGTKKRRLYYDTEREAKEDRERRQVEIDQREFGGIVMPVEVRRQVATWIEQLERRNLTLEEVVHVALEAYEAGLLPRDMLEAGKLMKSSCRA